MRSNGWLPPTLLIQCSATSTRPSGRAQTTDGVLIFGWIITVSTFHPSAAAAGRGSGGSGWIDVAGGVIFTAAGCSCAAAGFVESNAPATDAAKNDENKSLRFMRIIRGSGHSRDTGFPARAECAWS